MKKFLLFPVLAGIDLQISGILAYDIINLTQLCLCQALSRALDSILLLPRLYAAAAAAAAAVDDDDILVHVDLDVD